MGIVVDPSGVCIEGATVEVIAGPVLVGQKAMQTLPCDLAAGTGGFWFEEGAPAATDLTIRVSAPGYVSKEQDIEVDWTEALKLTLVPTKR